MENKQPPPYAKRVLLKIRVDRKSHEWVIGVRECTDVKGEKYICESVDRGTYYRSISIIDWQELPD